MKSIPLLVPDLPDAAAILPYLREIDAAKWYTNFGPLVRRFEAGLADLLRCPSEELTSVSSCTLGLEMALLALGLPRDAKVLLPALTFTASATAIKRAGFQPILADVDPETWLMSPAIARDVLRHQKFDCVMPVAAFGCPQPVDAWDDFSSESGIPVVIDAAGAFGNQQVGDLSVVVFSFHATKALGAGEGGAVVSRRRGLASKVRQLSNFGIDLASGMALFAGTNAKMSEYHAAVGLASLAVWEERQSMRRVLARQYSTSLRAAGPGIALQARPEGGIYTIMQILTPQEVGAAAVGAKLKIAGIETRQWYLPRLSEHPAFADNTNKSGLPVLEKLAPRMLGLPFYLGMKPADVAEICTELSRALVQLR